MYITETLAQDRIAQIDRRYRAGESSEPTGSAHNRHSANAAATTARTGGGPAPECRWLDNGGQDKTGILRRSISAITWPLPSSRNLYAITLSKPVKRLIWATAKSKKDCKVGAACNCAIVVCRSEYRSSIGQPSSSGKSSQLKDGCPATSMSEQMEWPTRKGVLRVQARKMDRTIVEIFRRQAQSDGFKPRWNHSGERSFARLLRRRVRNSWQLAVAANSQRRLFNDQHVAVRLNALEIGTCSRSQFERSTFFAVTASLFMSDIQADLPNLIESATRNRQKPGL